MKNYKDFTLTEYLDALAKREPVPGGGSAAALTGALGAGLISMVAQYSLAKGKSASIERKIHGILSQSERIRGRFLHLVDMDAEAYLQVVKARKEGEYEKKLALKAASKVPREVCCLAYEAVNLMPFLVENGNSYLLSDLDIALDMLQAAYNAGKINIRVNV